MAQLPAVIAAPGEDLAVGAEGDDVRGRAARRHEREAHPAEAHLGSSRHVPWYTMRTPNPMRTPAAGSSHARPTSRCGRCRFGSSSELSASPTFEMGKKVGLGLGFVFCVR